MPNRRKKKKKKSKSTPQAQPSTQSNSKTELVEIENKPIVPTSDKLHHYSDELNNIHQNKMQIGDGLTGGQSFVIEEPDSAIIGNPDIPDGLRHAYLHSMEKISGDVVKGFLEGLELKHKFWHKIVLYVLIAIVVLCAIFFSYGFEYDERGRVKFNPDNGAYENSQEFFKIIKDSKGNFILVPAAPKNSNHETTTTEKKDTSK